MSPHRQFLILAASAVDFELTTAEAAELHAHLDGCAACGAAQRTLAKQADGLRSRPRASAPARLAERVMAERAPRFPVALRPARLLLLAGLLIVALVSVALVGSGLTRLAVVEPSGDPAPSLTTTPAPTLTPTPSSFPTATPTIGVATDPVTIDAGELAHSHLCHVQVTSDCALDMVFSAGSLWLTRSKDVVRVEPATGAILATIPVGEFPHRFLVIGDRLWVTVESPGRVIRIDMDTNRVGATLEVGGQPYGITAIGNTLWVSDETSGDILAIDPATVKVTRRYQVAPGLTDLAAADGALWVTNVRDRTLRRVDPSTGRSTTVGSNVEGPQELVADGNDLLVAGLDSIGQVDLVTGDAERVLAPNMPSMDIGPDAVWTASNYNTVLQRRDPVTLDVVAEQPINVSDPDWQIAIAATADGVWLWTYTDDRLMRIEPATP